MPDREETISILTLGQLFPNREQKRNGIFVRERLAHLLKRGGIAANVVAPVPWFPSRNRAFGRYATFARVPEFESDIGCDIYHPRYIQLPRIGDPITPYTYATAIRRLLRRRPEIRIDLIDAHFVFPDGAAAIMLGRSLGCPVAITARGSDINSMPSEYFAGRWIRASLNEADACIGVSRPLCEKMIALGARRDRVHHIANGVDQDRFCIGDRIAARARLSWSGKTVISVGNLLELKGHHLAIDAVKALDDVSLVIVGSGPMRRALLQQITEAGVADRISILDEVNQDDLLDIYNAADCLVLASASEGLPNVLLESLACGLPVVATDVGGIGDVISENPYGTLVERDPDAIRSAVQDMIDRPIDRQQVRSSIESFDWRRTAEVLDRLFRSLCSVPQAVSTCT